MKKNKNEDKSDDPIRMYLREMGGVDLLSREGEIAIAKRIEAGKNVMTNGLFQSPITARKVFEWKEKLEKNELLVREIVDIDSTYIESEDTDQILKKSKQKEKKAVDEKLIDVGKIYKLSKLKIVKEIILPQLYPYLVSAARSGLALIWKIVLVVELLGRSNGVGFKINEFFSMFDITSILSYTIVFVFFIMVIEWFFIKPLEEKLTNWR